ALTPKRPRVEPTRNPTLFEMDKPEDAGRLSNSLHVERPYYEPGLLFGTSALTGLGGFVLSSRNGPDHSIPITDDSNANSKFAKGAGNHPLQCRCRSTEPPSVRTYGASWMSDYRKKGQDQ